MRTQTTTEVRQFFNMSLQELCDVIKIPFMRDASYTITLGMDSQEKRVEIIIVTTNVTQ
jgi:predicted RNase H-related nuclease YkuK (DUF458 family)